MNDCAPTLFGSHDSRASYRGELRASTDTAIRLEVIQHRFDSAKTIGRGDNLADDFGYDRDASPPPKKIVLSRSHRMRRGVTRCSSSESEASVVASGPRRRGMRIEIAVREISTGTTEYET